MKKTVHFGIFAKGLTLALIGLLSAACNLSVPPTQETPEDADTISICHATGDPNAPYEELTLTLDELPAHSKDSDDLVPVPAEGCPGELVPNGNDGKITICHATSDPTKPYNKITIAFSGLSGHSKHENDLILPSDAADCPTTETTRTPTVTATAPLMDETPTVTPTTTLTPEATAGSTDEKVTICHATGSKKNRYVMITVSVNGLNGHGNHKDDIIPAPAGGCPNN